MFAGKLRDFLEIYLEGLKTIISLEFLLSPLCFQFFLFHTSS